MRTAKAGKDTVQAKKKKKKEILLENHVKGLRQLILRQVLRPTGPQACLS